MFTPAAIDLNIYLVWSLWVGSDLVFAGHFMYPQLLKSERSVVEHDTHLSLANVFLCVSTGGTHSISILSLTPLLSRSCPLFSIPGWSLLSESTFMMLTSWRWWIQLCHTSVTFLQTVSDFIWSCLLMWSLSGLFFLRKHELCKKRFLYIHHIILNMDSV